MQINVTLTRRRFVKFFMRTLERERSA